MENSGREDEMTTGSDEIQRPSTVRATRRSSAIEIVAPGRSCEADASFGGLIQTA